MCLKRIGLCLSICLVALSSYSHAIDRAFERYSYIYHEKLMDEKYDELEQDARNARNSQDTISDGQPLLATIYGGTAGCLSLSCNYPRTLGEWTEKEKKLKSWLDQYPSSITAQISYAAFFIELGWFHRGGGYSHTVPRESWVLFKENIQKARGILEALPERTKKDAGWSFAMLGVALMQGWPEDQFNQLFYSAISQHPAYVPIYFKKSSYMEPKWYGSHEKFNKYVDEVVLLTKPFLGNQMYARLHWSSSNSKLFRSGRTDWRKMKLGFEELIEKYPDQWNINNYAKFSCLAGDREKLRELLVVIGGKPLKKAWYNSLEYFHRCSAYSRES